MDLYGRARNDVDLLTAIEQCGDLLLQAPSIALLYAPDWCGFAQVEQKNGSVVMDPSPGAAKRFDQAMIFEARVFGEQAELRWLKQWPKQGRAVLIAEHDISKCLADDAGSFKDTDHFDHSYLLWGEGTTNFHELPTNWSRLAMARIGTLDVPYPMNSGLSSVTQQNERVYLVAREYLAVSDDDQQGNVSVVDERLLKLVDENELIRMGQAGVIKLEVLQ